MYATEKKTQSNNHDFQVLGEADILQHSKNLCLLILCILELLPNIYIAPVRSAALSTRISASTGKTKGFQASIL